MILFISAALHAVSSHTLQIMGEEGKKGRSSGTEEKWPFEASSRDHLFRVPHDDEASFRNLGDLKHTP